MGSKSTITIRKDKLTEICNNLSIRLASRGLIPVEKSRLIKDVSNIIHDGKGLTVASINQQLENLGWMSEVLDEVSFELIVFVLENSFESVKTLHIPSN